MPPALREVRAWRGRLPWLVPLAMLVVVGITLVDPLRRSDLMVFLRAADDVAHGINPYTPVDDPFLWQGSAYVYPYLTAYLFVPLTWVPVPAADVLWFLLSAGAVVVGCRVLGLRDPVGITAVLVSAAAIRTFQVGALNAVLFLGLALAWRHRDSVGRLAWSLTLAAGAKLFLLPVLVWVALSRSRRALGWVTAGLVLYVGLGQLLAPLSLHAFVRSMGVLADHEGPTSMSVLRWSTGLLPGSAARLAPAVLGLAVVLAGAAWSRRHRCDGDPVLFVACLVGSMLATPIYWSHYTLLLGVAVLVARPTRGSALLFCAATWLVSRPVLTWSAHQPTMGHRLLMLYALMAAALLATAHGARRAATPVSEVHGPVLEASP